MKRTRDGSSDCPLFESRPRRWQFKMVRFSTGAPEIIWRTIEYTEKDTRRCWFTPLQYLKIASNRKKCLQEALLLKGAASEEYCFRGLERFQSKRHKKLYKTHQASVVQAVLKEQEQQRQTGCAFRDDHQIRRASKMLSQVAVQTALELAQCDQAEVMGGTRNGGQYDDECGFFLHPIRSAELEQVVVQQARLDLTTMTSSKQISVAA